MDNNELVKALRKAYNFQDWPIIASYATIVDRKTVLAAADTIEQLTAQLATVTAERDAAIKDMHHNDACTVCIGSAVEVLGCDCECLGCQLECRCKDCRDENKWQWRGAQEKVPCEYCGAPSPSSDCVLHDGTEQILCSRDGLFGDCYIMHRKICFCPMCGKPLKGD